MQKSVQKISKYAIVGFIGAFTHLSILAFLVEILHFNPVQSSAFAFIITVIISYYLNYKWTFKSKSKHRVAFLRYATVCIIGLCINISIIFFTVNVLKIWYVIGQAIAVIVIPISNFILNFYWSFKA